MNIDVGTDAAALGVTVDRTGSTPKLRLVAGDSSSVFSYQVTDGVNSSSAVVTVPVLKNRAPVAQTMEVAMTPDDTSLTVDVGPQLSDVDGDDVVLYREAKPEADRADVFGNIEWDASTTSFVITRNEAFETGADVTITYRFSDVPQTGLTPKSGTGTVIVRVEPRRNTPPEVESQVPLTMESGTSATIDLARLAHDPDAGDTLTFDVAGSGLSSGLSASQSGSSVTLTSPIDAVTGEPVTQSVEFTASDGKDTATGSLQVTLKQSRKPGPQAVDDQMATLDQGRGAGRLDVVRNDVPSEVGGTKVVRVGLSEHGTTTVVDDNTVEFTPEPDFSGTTSFTYTVRDARDDPNFESSATVVVSVRDRPETPGRPTIGETASRRAVVSFTSPSDNGAPIDTYEVRTTPGGSSTSCTGSPCIVNDLTNGTEYQFEVRAHNAVDWSDWSETSSSYIPDEVPDAPRPEVVWDDSKIDINWAAIPNDGSLVLDVRVTLNPAPAGGQPQPVSGGQDGGHLTVTGLQNGTAYNVTLVARNRQGEGPISEASAPSIPVGPPRAARITPSVTDGNGEVVVSWTQPDGNGDNNLTYDVLLFDASNMASPFSTTTAGTALSTRVPATNGVTYRVQLLVHNQYTDLRSNQPVPSALSAAVIPAGPPLPVSAVTATVGGGDGTVHLSFGAADGNGRPVSNYLVSVNGGAFVARRNFDGDHADGGRRTCAWPVVLVPGEGGEREGPRRSEPDIERGGALSTPRPAERVVRPPKRLRDPMQLERRRHQRPRSVHSFGQFDEWGRQRRSHQPGQRGRCQQQPRLSNRLGYQRHGLQQRNRREHVLDRGGASAQTIPRPNPLVSTQRGAVAGPCDVGVGTCYWITINVSGFSPGNHQYRCFNGENIPGFGVRTGTIGVAANGTGSASTSSGGVCYAATRNDAGIDVNDGTTWRDDTGPNW